MPIPTKASAFTAELSACLQLINPANGYLTDLAQVYTPENRVPDGAAMPYALIRPVADARTGQATYEATRLRTYEIELVFSKVEGEQALCSAHVDVLRALGFGQDLPARKFPGLLDEPDEVEFRWGQKGETTNSITITLGVTYVERYN
jgi:hypothetical protein